MGNAASLGWGAAGSDSWKERGWEDGLGACSLTVPSRASRRTASPVPGKCGAGLWKGQVKGEEVDRWPEPAEAWRLGGRVRSARSQPPFPLCCGRSRIPARRAIHSPMLTGVTHVSSQGPPGAPLASRSLHGYRSLSDCPWQGRRRAQRRTRDTRPWERSAEGRCAGRCTAGGTVRNLDSPGLEMMGNCSWEAHPGGRSKMCPDGSEAPELYGRGFLTIEQISRLPPPAVMNYVFLLLCLCGLVGNGLILWFFGFSIKRSPFSVYFLHLAGADVGYLFSKAVLSVLNTGGFLGTFADYVRAVARVMGLCTFVAGVSLLPAVSSERCLSVILPVWYWRRRPKRLSAVVCTLLWTLSLLLTGIHHYCCVFLAQRASGGACGSMDAFLGILLFLVFGPLMVLPCLLLTLRVECRARRRQRSAKLNHVILAMVAVFLVSSIYLGIDWFLFWVFQIPAPFPEYITDLCICIHSSSKPVIYFLAGRDKSQRLWEPLRVVFQRALRDGAELGEAGGGTANTVTMEMQCPSGNAS